MSSSLFASIGRELTCFGFSLNRAQHLVKKCLVGRLMRHRTCILVTHAVDLCLPVAAFVVSMDNGAVVAAKAPEELSAKDKNLLAAFVAEEQTEASASAIMIEAIAEGDTDEDVIAQKAAEKKERQEKLKLVKDETQSEGAVSREVYL